MHQHDTYLPVLSTQPTKKALRKERLLYLIIFTLFVDCIAQLCTGLELGNLLGSDLNLLLGSGVDAFTGGALGNSECAETYELNLVTGHEGILNSVYCGIKGLLSVCLAQFGSCSNLLDQF